MTRRTSHLSEELYAYLLGISLRELPVMRRLREETASMEQANMQIGPEQGQFMALLVEFIGARSVLEVGTFTGYSALAMAVALAENACQPQPTLRLAGGRGGHDIHLGIRLEGILTSRKD